MAKIGLYLCECGPNIAQAIDLDEITEAIKKDNKVAGIERHKLLCSDDGKKFLAESIKRNAFERVVIAACSPKQHEGTFMEVMLEAGLNAYMFQLVNIREQCAWVTPDKNAATLKALTVIRAAINRVKHHAALEKKEIECNPNVIVIGNGIAAIEAALKTAHNDRKVFLIVEGKRIGDTYKNRRLLLSSMQSAEEFLRSKVDELKSNKQIEVFENSKINEILGFFGNFIANIDTEKNKNVELAAGSVIFALEAESFVPKALTNLGYGKFDKVYTAAEFETIDVDETEPKSVAIIHCVGRKKLGYCSKFCCMNSMKIARYIKERSHESKVVQFYRNLCLPDKQYDKFYKDTKEKGVEFVRFQDIEVAGEESRLAIKYKEENGKENKLLVDIVILSTGLVPASKTEEFSQMFNIPLDEYGFMKEEHNILNPVATITEGVFIIGGVRGPGDIDDSLEQAGAAAGKILSSLVPGRLQPLETKISRVSEVICIGCGVCVNVCAYGAVKLDESKHISVVNEVLCRGCGNCASACPSGAAQHRHFTTKQINQEMIEILK